MDKEERKRVIKIAQDFFNKHQLTMECNIEAKEFQAFYHILLDYQKLQKENEEKDKQIDLMAEYWHCGLAICENCANYDEYKCKICIKQYFERKVKDVKKTKTEKMQKL